MESYVRSCALEDLNTRGARNVMPLVPAHRASRSVSFQPDVGGHSRTLVYGPAQRYCNGIFRVAGVVWQQPLIQTIMTSASESLLPLQFYSETGRFDHLIFSNNHCTAIPPRSPVCSEGPGRDVPHLFGGFPGLPLMLSLKYPCPTSQE
jgi:hypothetical protein